MLEWVVVADDFTGAAELGAAVRRLGFTIGLSRRTSGSVPKNVDIWVIDTDTRELAPSVAESCLSEVGSRLRSELPDVRVFKKIDSVLRGACRAESEVLASELGRTQLAVVPGNPRRGREVRDGRLLVEGVSLENTVFGDDPTFPAETADVRILWDQRGAMSRVATEIAHEVTAGRLAELAEKAVGPGILPVGALDFFEACIQNTTTEREALPSPSLPRQGGALLVCGSRAGWPQRADWFNAHGWSVTTQGLPDVSCGSRLLGIGLEPAGEAAACAKDLAERAAAHIRATRPALICLEGGASAAAVLAELGWEDFELMGEVAAGTAALRPAGEPTVVLVKPGSYPWPEAVRAAFASSKNKKE